jgi:two-component system sensor histidine kinase KdpD
MDAGMRLAEELGATTATLAGDDIVAELISYAQQENVTTIVMGKPVRQRWKEIVFGSVVDHTVRSSGNIDVLIITGDEDKLTGVPDAEVMKQNIARSQMRVVAKAGHYSPWEQPDEVGKLLRQFLDSNPTS